MSLLDIAIESDLDVVTRVQCPICYRRQKQALDCICCGGIGFVEVERVQGAIDRALPWLADLKQPGDAHSWISPGIYRSSSREWFVRFADGSIKKVNQEFVDSVIQSQYSRPPKIVKRVSDFVTVTLCYVTSCSVFVQFKKCLRSIVFFVSKRKGF